MGYYTYFLHINIYIYIHHDRFWILHNLYMYINKCHERFWALHNFYIYPYICGSQVLKNIKILGNTLFIYQKIWSRQCLHIKRDLRYTTSTYTTSTQYISRARDLDLKYTISTYHNFYVHTKRFDGHNFYISRCLGYTISTYQDSKRFDVHNFYILRGLGYTTATY